MTGRIEFNAAVRINDEEDQVNTSIWPGMSIKRVIFFPGKVLNLLTTALITTSGAVRNKLSAVKMAPLGPSWYYFMILVREMYTLIMMSLSNIQDGFVFYVFDCWVKIDDKDFFIGVSYGLYR